MYPAAFVSEPGWDVGGLPVYTIFVTKKMPTRTFEQVKATVSIASLFSY